MPHLLRAALLALLLTACSSGGTSGPDVPDESAFAEGTCRTAAPDVRAVGEALPELGDDNEVPGEVKDALRESQDRLAALADGAEGDVGPALSDLVEKIGIVRIRADGNTYDASLGDVLTRSYEKAVEVCTKPAAG